MSSDDESDEDSNENDIEGEVNQLLEKGDNETKKVLLADCEETIIPRSVGDSSATPRYGSAPVYIINGKPTPVAHHSHYAFRNVDLQHLSYYEYSGIISVVLKRTHSSTISSSSVNDALVSKDSANNIPMSEKKGRKRNETFDFDNRHPLHATYTQRLRSLQQTPVLAGGPPPRYPGPRPLNPSKNLLKQADQYACYIMTAFCPWNVQTLLPNLDPTWMGLREFMRQLNGDGGKRSPTFLERSRDKLIQNVTQNLSVNSKNKRMMTAWRNKSSTHWNGEPDWLGDFQQRINKEEAPQFMQQHEQHQAVKDIDSIRIACGVIDEESLIEQARHDKALSNYIQNSLTALENIFEPQLSRTNGENNTNNYMLQVYSRDPNFPTYKNIQSELKKNWITESSATKKKEGRKAFNIRYPVTKKSPYNYQQQRLLDQMATFP